VRPLKTPGPAFRRAGLAAVLLLGPAAASHVQAREYVCFSLVRAHSLLQSEVLAPPLLAELGFITRPKGIVVDASRGDVVVVGVRDPDSPAILLDDLVVALRVARVEKVAYPGLSIEPAPWHADPWEHRVIYTGKIEGTRLGLVCYEADVLLKKMCLGTVPTGSPDVISPWVLGACYRPARREEEGGTKTYFYPLGVAVSVVGNAAYLQADRITVQCGTQSGRPADPPLARFLLDLNEHFDEVASYHTVLEDLRNVCCLYALARGLQKVTACPDLGYWLREYRPARVPTPEWTPVIARGVRGLSSHRVSAGKIEVRAEAEYLEDGDAVALARIVLESRPAGDPLVWSFAIRGDSLTTAGDSDEAAAIEAESRARFQAAREEAGGAVALECSPTLLGEPVMGTLGHSADARAWMALGLAREAQGRRAEASEAYRRAIGHGSPAAVHRRAYERWLRLRSALGLEPFDRLPPGFGPFSPCVVTARLESLPRLAASQALMPDSLKKLGYHDALAVPLRGFLSMALTNRVRCGLSATLDLRSNLALTGKRAPLGSGPDSVDFQNRTRGIYVMPGSLELAAEYLALDGMWSSPYLLAAASFSRSTGTQPLVAYYPFLRKGWKVIPRTAPARHAATGWSLAMRFEQPVRLGSWLCLQAFGSGYVSGVREPTAGLDLTYRSILAMSPDAYEYGIGGRFRVQDVRAGGTAEEASVHAALARNAGGVGRSLELALFRLREPKERPTLYVTVSLEFAFALAETWRWL